MLIMFLEGRGGRGGDGRGRGRDGDGTGTGRGRDGTGGRLRGLGDEVPGQRRVPLLVIYKAY